MLKLLVVDEVPICDRAILGAEVPIQCLALQLKWIPFPEDFVDFFQGHIAI